MDGLKNTEAGAASLPRPAPGMWEKALAYSEMKEYLQTPEQKARFIASLEGSLTDSLGVDRESANKADLSGILYLLFTGETFSFTDEYGTRYMWSVTQAKEVIAAAQVAAQDFDLAGQGITPERLMAQYPGLDTEKAASANLSEPVIFIGFKGEHLLIDGWHRMYRAVSENAPTIPSYVLTEEEAGTILVSETPKGGGDDE